jgi:hypothetical protein
MYRFAYDHSCSDGARGYGAVRVTTPTGGVFYIGAAFARTVLVERFPGAGLTYHQAAELVAALRRLPSYRHEFEFESLVATNGIEPGDFDLSGSYDCESGDHYWSDAVARIETCRTCGSQREAR